MDSLRPYAFSTVILTLFTSYIAGQGPAFKANEVRIQIKDEATKKPIAGIPVAFEHWTVLLTRVWYTDSNGFARPGIFYPDAIPKFLPRFRVWALAKGRILTREFNLPPWDRTRSHTPSCKNCRDILFYSWSIDLAQKPKNRRNQNPTKPADCDKWTTEIVSGPNPVPCECSGNRLFCVTVTGGKAPDQKKRVKTKLKARFAYEAGVSMTATLGGYGLEAGGKKNGGTEYEKEVDEEINIGTENYGPDDCGQECLAVMETQWCIRSVYYGCVLIRGHHNRNYWKKILVQSGDPYPVRLPTGICVGFYRYSCKKGKPKPGSNDDPCKDYIINPKTCRK